MAACSTRNIFLRQDRYAKDEYQDGVIYVHVGHSADALKAIRRFAEGGGGSSKFSRIAGIACNIDEADRDINERLQAEGLAVVTRVPRIPYYMVSPTSEKLRGDRTGTEVLIKRQIEAEGDIASRGKGYQRPNYVGEDEWGRRMSQARNEGLDEARSNLMRKHQLVMRVFVQALLADAIGILEDPTFTLGRVKIEIEFSSSVFPIGEFMSDVWGPNDAKRILGGEVQEVHSRWNVWWKVESGRLVGEVVLTGSASKGSRLIGRPGGN